MGPKFKIKSKYEQAPQQPLIQELPEEEAGPGISNFANLKIEARELNLNTE